MIPQQGTWRDLHVGAYMKDKNGKTWKVVAERDFHLKIQDRDGKTHTLPPKDPRTAVTLVVPTQSEAESALREHLGAREIAALERGAKVWDAGEFREKGPGALLDAKSHLYLMHGVWANDIKQMSDAREAHEACTEDPGIGMGYVPHHHGVPR